jgi:hypothetical protein
VLWWDEVAREVRDVIAACSISEAAEAIDWRHHDWTPVSDTSREAAKRIRVAAVFNPYLFVASFIFGHAFASAQRFPPHARSLVATQTDFDKKMHMLANHRKGERTACAG